MSERIAILSPSFTRPIAMPATGCLIGTPASISASVPPQTEAIDDEPFDSRMSETMRTVYGKPSFAGQHVPQRPLGERAVADLATARAAQRLGLAHRERGEVVVEHEASGTPAR